MVVTDRPLGYDLYINSSAIESREKFVRIFPAHESLSRADLEQYQIKYRRLYVHENQRSAYLKSLCTVEGKDAAETTAVLKDSAIHYLENLFSKPESITVETLNETIAGCRDVVENMVDVLQEADIERLKDLIASLSFHDFYTYDHSINVSMYSITIYRLLKPTATRAEIVQSGMGGLLHDIGKIKLPTSIINKPGKLTDEEFALIKQHPGWGSEFLQVPGLQLPKEINPKYLERTILEHHENFDGTGYPARVSGENILIHARVTAIADFFDAITTKRSYHSELSNSAALDLMRKTAGKKIDPKIFEVFASHIAHLPEHESPLELAADFDPCQPHQELPLSRCEHSTVVSMDPKSFGKIHLIKDSIPKAPSTKRRA